MPSSLLRALTNRSTPTLPSERAAERQKNVRMALTPSIFITLPLEEGGHFWCVYPGSACPMPLPAPSTATASGSNSSFDAPIPDIAAIEETVDRLRRAGETPTFRRPSRANEVVLPKKKYAHAHGHDHHNRHGLEDSASVSNTMGRSSPEDGKKKRKSRPPPLTSISYESIVSQAFSPTSPEAFHVSMPRDTGSPKPKEKKRSSLGWIFSSSKRSPVRKDNNMGSVFEAEQFEAQFAVTRHDEDAEITLDQVMESTLPNSPGAESTHTTATLESDLHKPLPPLPPSKSIPQQVAEDRDLSLARYQSRGLPTEPVEQQKDSNESASRPSTPSKIKRKFSLKKLRERFISSPAPPVPELPNTAVTQAGNIKPTSNAIVGIASVSSGEPIDPPFTPPPIPSLDSVPREFSVMNNSIEVVEAIESSSSGPIDPPFTPPLSVPESESSSSHALETETVIAVPLLLKDEETELDLSTASEDSSNTAGSSAGESSSNTSTPESSPPDTPANVDFGPIFGMDQVATKLPLDLLPAAVMEKKMEVVLNEGMTRSNGYRNKLASLHFDQIEFDTSAF